MNPLRILTLLSLLFLSSTAGAVSLVGAPQFTGGTGKGDGSVYVELVPLPRAYAVLGGAVGIGSTPKIIRYNPRAGATTVLALRQDATVAATSFGTERRQMVVVYSDGIIDIVDRETMQVARSSVLFSTTSLSVVKAMYHEPSGRLFTILRAWNGGVFWQEYDISALYDLTNNSPGVTTGASGAAGGSCGNLTADECRPFLRLLDMSTGSSERRYLIYGIGQAIARPASGSTTLLTFKATVNNFPVTEFISSAVYDPVGNRFLAAMQTDNSSAGGNVLIFRLDNSAITRHYLGGSNSSERDIAFDPRTGRTIVTVRDENRFYVTHLASGTTTAFGATVPYAVALNTMSGRAYVLQGGGGTGHGAFVTECNLAAGTTSIFGFEGPPMSNGEVAIDPVANLVYTLSRNTFPPAILTVLNVDPNVISPAIPTGAITSVAIDARRGDASLVDSSSARVDKLLFGMQGIAATAATSAMPQSPVIDPVSGETYVASPSGNGVSVIRADGMLKTSFAACGTSPSLLALDSNTAVLYVGCADAVKAYRTADLTEIGAKSGIGPVRAMHFNQRRRLLYVATDTHVRIMRAVAGQNLEVHAMPAPAPGVALAPAHDSMLLLAGAAGQTATVHRISDSFAITTVTTVGTIGSNLKGMVTATSDPSGTFGFWDDQQPNRLNVRPWTAAFISNGSENAIRVVANLTWDANGMASFAPVRTVNLPSMPLDLAVDTAAARAYVPLFTNGLMMIDAASTTFGWIPVRFCNSRWCSHPPDGPTALGVDSVRQRIVTSNAMSTTASVVDARALGGTPYIATTIIELTNHVASSSSPSFSLVTQANTFPGQLPSAVWFQVDSVRGAWTPAGKTGANSWSAPLKNLSPGMHTLYAYAVDANVRAADGGRDPLVGALAQYTFFVPCTQPSARAVMATDAQTGLTGPFCSGRPVKIAEVDGAWGPFQPDVVLQWYRDGVALTDDGVYSGTRTRTLTFTATEATAGSYSARFVNSCGASAQSNPETVTVSCP